MANCFCSSVNFWPTLPDNKCKGMCLYACNNSSALVLSNCIFLTLCSRSATLPRNLVSLFRAFLRIEGFFHAASASACQLSMSVSLDCLHNTSDLCSNRCNISVHGCLRSACFFFNSSNGCRTVYWVSSLNNRWHK